ncbi:MAG: hypothetical protein HN420_01710 [Rhodospirillaceae bacterium]|nr:hypothetical protein [Rhodospirillaceae bacterium]
MKKAAVIRSVLLSIVLTILVFLFLATQARAEETLSPTGSKLAAVTVNPVLVTCTVSVALGADTPTTTHVTAHTASGKALQRSNLGYWVPWDGNLMSLIDNHFTATGGTLVFKVVKDENMSDELFPIRVMVAYRTAVAFKYGVFELRTTTATK